MKSWLCGCFAALGLIGVSVKAAPPLLAYGALPAVESVALSPDGKEIASIAVDGDVRRLFVRHLNGQPVDVFGLKNNKVRSIEWVGNDRLVVLVSETVRLGYRGMHNYEWLTAVGVDLKAKKSFSLLHGTDKAFGNILAYFGSVQSNGQWYAYVASQSVGGGAGFGGVALFRVNLDSGASQLVGFLDIFTYSWILDGQANIVARSAFNPSTKAWSILAGSAGNRAMFSKQSAAADLDADGLGRDPNTIIVHDESEGEDHYFEVSLDKLSVPRPIFTNIDNVKLQHDRITKLLIGGVDGRTGVSVFFDPALQARYDAAVKPFEQYRPSLISYDSAFNRLIIFTNGGDDSGTYWLVDLSTGKASSVAQAYPTIGPSDVGTRSEINYKSADGLTIGAVLTLPPGRHATDLPLVVLPHGGPVGVSDDVGFDWWAEGFASKGYAVLQPNYRGSGGYGAAFRRAGDGEWGRKMLTDVSDGVSYLAAQHIIDPKRVCVVGASYGGYAALAGVTLQHGIYRCAVSYGGVSDLAATLDRLGNRYGVPARQDERTMGVAWSGDPLLKVRSPLYQADQADAPILLIHGKDDSVVPISESERMDRALTAAGKPHKFLPLDGEDHWLSSSATRTQVLQASVDFVLKNDPPN